MQAEDCYSQQQYDVKAQSGLDTPMDTSCNDTLISGRKSSLEGASSGEGGALGRGRGCSGDSLN